MTTATSATSPGHDASVPENYEAALAELEVLVAAMEGGQLPLEGLLEGYRRGTRLLQFCRGRLEAVEQQVKVLEDGQLKPWPAA
jgi:exodeoxyribonuclease VII small subunit